VVLGKRLLPSGQPSHILVGRIKVAVTAFLDSCDINKDIMLVTGGQVEKGPKIPTEAKMMQSMARKLGVPIGSIIMEDKARSTMDNCHYSKDILDYMGICNLIIVTSKFHMNRTKLIFNSVFKHGKGIQWYNLKYKEDLPQLSPKELAKEESVEENMLEKLKVRLQGDGYDLKY